MARSSSAALPLVLLAAAALLLAPSFVPSPAPRAASSLDAGVAVAAGAALPLLAAQPALAAEDYMMPPSWPFILIFLALASGLLVVGNFIFPGKRPGEA